MRKRVQKLLSSRRQKRGFFITTDTQISTKGGLAFGEKNTDYTNLFEREKIENKDIPLKEEILRTKGFRL